MRLSKDKPPGGMSVKLPRPPLVEEKLLAVVDGEWRTAREIHALFDEGELSTARGALCRLANVEKVDRRYDPHPTERIARYRRSGEALAAGIKSSR